MLVLILLQTHLLTQDVYNPIKLTNYSEQKHLFYSTAKIIKR